MRPRPTNCATGSASGRNFASPPTIFVPQENWTRRHRRTNSGLLSILEIRVPTTIWAQIICTWGSTTRLWQNFQAGLRLNPDNAILYSNLGETYLALNRLDEANAAFDQAFVHKLDSGILRLYVYDLAFLQRDTARMEQQVVWAAGKPGDEDVLLSAQSDTEAYYGRMSKARDFSRRAVESAVRADSKETAGFWRVNAALREAELGDIASAKDGVAAALALSSGQDVKTLAALTLARIGDAVRATIVADELKKNSPTNTMLKVYWLPTINAAIELSRHNSARAIALLEA